jgi:hypothetical protein
VALPGVTSIRYGAAASTLRDTINSADSAWRRYEGPRENTASVQTAIAAIVPAYRRTG